MAEQPDIVEISIGSQTIGLTQTDLENILGIVQNLSDGPWGGVVNPVIDILLNSSLGGLFGGAMEAVWAVRDGVTYDQSAAYAESHPLFARFAAAGDGTPIPLDSHTQAVVDGISGFVARVTPVIEGIHSALQPLEALLPPLHAGA